MAAAVESRIKELTIDGAANSLPQSGYEGSSAQMLTKLKAIPELKKAIVFDSTGDVLASTFKKYTKEELVNLLGLFADRQLAFAGGMNIGDDHYEVHRWYDKEGLIYGRKMDEPDGEGAALVKLTSSSGKIFLVLGTYDIPILSSRVVPILQTFASANCILVV